MIIKAIVDYIPITIYDFLVHIFFVFYPWEFINKSTENKDYIEIYGYSCRSLYHTIIELLTNNNKREIIITPIHHTSFRNITEQFINNENISILRLNKYYNKITGISDDINRSYDICIVSHMFGIDMDISYLYEIKNQNPTCVFIEDRVQGGTFDKKFSDDIFDISLYSTGMDKKPCALGGGIAYIKKNEKTEIIIDKITNHINNYRYETRLERFIFLIKKIPSYLLYNNRCVINIVLNLFRYFSLDLYKFIKYYRVKNPGFTHNNYNYKPSISLINSINYSLSKYKILEKIYNQKSSNYISELNKKNNNLMDLIPYIKIDDNINDIFYIINMTTYNSICIKNKDKFINFLNKKYIPVIDNPTYKLFNHKYDNKDVDELFNNSIIYIPSLVNMDINEIKYLCSTINDFVKTCN